MELTNDAKDVVGLLRGVNFIVLIWNVDSLLFPLDEKIRQVLENRREDLSCLLGIISRISQMVEEIQELRSAIEDLVPDAERIYYTESQVASLLSLYACAENTRTFSFGDRSMFYRDTRPLVLSLFSRLMRAVLWVRVAYYDFNPASCLPDLCTDLRSACEALSKVCPAEAEMPAAPDLLAAVVSDWRASPDIQRGLQLTKEEPGNGLYRIVDELHPCS